MAHACPVRLALLCSFAVVAACSTEAITRNPDDAQLPLLQRRQIEVPETPAGPTIDQLFEDIARQAPSFGGFYTDAQGLLVIQLVDTAEAQTARAGVASRSGLSQAADINGSRIDRVDYSFKQLQAWRHELLQEGVPAGVYTADIDERDNQVRFGQRQRATFPLKHFRCARSLHLAGILTTWVARYDLSSGERRFLQLQEAAASASRSR
jgi:hypothetical protein